MSNFIANVIERGGMTPVPASVQPVAPPLFPPAASFQASEPALDLSPSESYFDADPLDEGAATETISAPEADMPFATTSSLPGPVAFRAKIQPRNLPVEKVIASPPGAPPIRSNAAPVAQPAETRIVAGKVVAEPAAAPRSGAAEVVRERSAAVPATPTIASERPTLPTAPQIATPVAPKVAGERPALQTTPQPAPPASSPPKANEKARQETRHQPIVEVKDGAPSKVPSPSQVQLPGKAIPRVVDALPTQVDARVLTPGKLEAFVQGNPSLPIADVPELVPAVVAVSVMPGAQPAQARDTEPTAAFAVLEPAPPRPLRTAGGTSAESAAFDPTALAPPQSLTRAPIKLAHSEAPTTWEQPAEIEALPGVQERTVHIRIGTVELRSSAPAPAQPQTPAEPIGFERYESIRSYARRADL